MKRGIMLNNDKNMESSYSIIVGNGLEEMNWSKASNNRAELSPNLSDYEHKSIWKKLQQVITQIYRH